MGLDTTGAITLPLHQRPVATSTRAGLEAWNTAGWSLDRRIFRGEWEVFGATPDGKAVRVSGPRWEDCVAALDPPT